MSASYCLIHQSLGITQGNSLQSNVHPTSKECDLFFEFNQTMHVKESNKQNLGLAFPATM